LNILIVDDDNASRESISIFLKELGHNITECSDGVSALKNFSPNYYDVIFSDIKMPLMSGIELVKKIRSLPGGGEVNIILFTGFSETQSAIEALRYGVYDYLLKPINIEEIVSAIDRIAQFKLLKKKNELLSAGSGRQIKEPGDSNSETNAAQTAPKSDGGHDEKFRAADGSDTQTPAGRAKRLPGAGYSFGLNKIGVFSAEMKKIFSYAKMLHEDRSIPVLIEGETGSGKEMVAQFIHYGGGKENRLPFVDINCACISANLFESELFGYAAGAFTGGLDKGQPGKLDLASGGTIFLDEIGDMPLEMQAKLLRVIQEKEYYRVGGLKKIKTDLRIICATNMRLEELVINAGFRQDLYYRLNVGRIYIPALRERRDEILPLAEMFLADISGRKGKKFKHISRGAETVLLAYDWPGNIRQLRNVIERAVFMYDAASLEPEHLDVISKSVRPGGDNHHAASSGGTGGGPMNQSTPDEAFDFKLPAGKNFPLNAHIYSIIKKALILNGYNKTRTAEYLNITRRTLYSYLKHI
jgi:DNA-binding NtrC family response regulator